jgi:proteic killer suppression protein
MIHNFRSKEARAIWEGDFVKGLPHEIQDVARRKLRMLNAARKLDDLRIPPANRLEARYFRINDQWRVCFTWTGAGAKDVEIVDYH